MKSMLNIGDTVTIYVPSLGFISAEVVDIYRDYARLHSPFGEYRRPLKDLIFADSELIGRYRDD